MTSPGSRARRRPASAAPASAGNGPALVPHPPRPNRLFLLAATLLLVAWMGFLVVMAWMVRS